MYIIHFSEKAQEKLKELRDDKSEQKRFKLVNKTIKILKQQGPTYPGLQTHPYKNLLGPNGEKIRGSYAENNTPRAYRVLWYFGPKRKEMTIWLITPHI